MSERLPVGRTLPQLLLKSRERWGRHAVSLRTKEYGIWREIPWDECCERTKAIFLGLRSLGLKAGTHVCILGRNSPEWLLCEMAVQAARGIPNGINEGLSAEDTERLISTVGVELALAEGQEQVDKLLGIKARLPQLKRIVYWRAKGVERYTDPVLLSLEELIRVGGECEATHPQDFEGSVAEGKNDDVAIQLLTLTAGQVKSVPVTHEFVVSFAEATPADGVSHGRKRPDYVAGNNPCWFFEQALGYARCLTAGQILNFPESNETTNRDFREISPQIIVRPPQSWNATASAIKGNLGVSTRLKRAVSRCGLSMGYQGASSHAEDRRAGIVKRSLRRCADLMVLGPLRDKHGLNKAKLAYVAGGAVSNETSLLFRAININLREVYCSTGDGLVTANPGEETGLN